MSSWNSSFIRGIFFFQGPIDREIRTPLRIKWSFAQMCCAMTLVYPSISTHRTCKFWARKDPVNMPKAIESSAKCAVRAVIRFLYSEKATRNVVLRFCSSSWKCSAAQCSCNKEAPEAFRWEVFDHPPSWLTEFFISFLLWNGRSRTAFWHK